jgi:hypothetical protein
MVRTFALEYTAQFLGEYRTELYTKYCSGGTESKILLGAKNASQGQACLGLERRGA